MPLIVSIVVSFGLICAVYGVIATLAAKRYGLRGVVTACVMAAISLASIASIRSFVDQTPPPLNASWQYFLFAFLVCLPMFALGGVHVARSVRASRPLDRRMMVSTSSLTLVGLAFSILMGLALELAGFP